MAGDGRQPVMSVVTLASSSLLFFVAFAYIAVVERSSSNLPDLLVEIKLGGKMKINTANGPMLLSVGKHMQCKQCHSTGFTQKGFSQLASCPCEVPVGGMKDGVYYSGVITVTRVDKDEPDVQEVVPERNAEPKDLNGCNTKPLHLRVTAKGTFLEGLPVYAGDARTEAMLRQLLEFFGPDKQKGLVLDGTLTCKQEWDLLHPDYLIPKPGYPSDVAVKIPYGSTLRRLRNKLSPFKTEVPEVLRQTYGDSKESSRLRKGLLAAEQSPLFQRDAAQFRKRDARDNESGRSDEDVSGDSRRSSMQAMLRQLAKKVDRIQSEESRMDGTLQRVNNVMNYASN